MQLFYSQKSYKHDIDAHFKPLKLEIWLVIIHNRDKQFI